MDRHLDLVEHGPLAGPVCADAVVQSEGRRVFRAPQLPVPDARAAAPVQAHVGPVLAVVLPAGDFRAGRRRTVVAVAAVRLDPAARLVAAEPDEERLARLEPVPVGEQEAPLRGNVLDVADTTVLADLHRVRSLATARFNVSDDGAGTAGPAPDRRGERLLSGSLPRTTGSY